MCSLRINKISREEVMGMIWQVSWKTIKIKFCLRILMIEKKIETSLFILIHLTNHKISNKSAGKVLGAKRQKLVMANRAQPNSTHPSDPLIRLEEKEQPEKQIFHKMTLKNQDRIFPIKLKTIQSGQLTLLIIGVICLTHSSRCILT